MSDKRYKLPRPKPRLVDRFQLAISKSRHVDGLWIGCTSGVAEHLTRVEAALLLVRQHSPLDYARITSELERIWVTLSFHGAGEFNPALRACLIDERYLANPATSLELLASTIVHETTHARLDRYGIEYREELRVRIEEICFRRELAFAARLPDGAALRQSVTETLEWSQANPDRFSNARFDADHTPGAVEALRHVGVPEWLIRVIVMLQPVVTGVRRLFRFIRR